MFGLSNSSGYALLALSYLERNEGRWVLAKNIAEFTSIPHPYLLKILNILSQSGLVLTKAGYRGGFKLAKPTTEISLWQIAEAIEGPDMLSRCLLGLSECTDDRACPTHEFWKKERQGIEKLLRKMSLAKVSDFEWEWRFQGKTECGEDNIEVSRRDVR